MKRFSVFNLNLFRTLTEGLVHVRKCQEIAFANESSNRPLVAPLPFMFNTCSREKPIGKQEKTNMNLKFWLLAFLFDGDHLHYNKKGRSIAPVSCKGVRLTCSNPLTF